MKTTSKSSNPKQNWEKVFVPVTCNILKETEKAYQVSVYYWTKAENKNKEAKMWCPKSCAQITDGKVIGICDFILNGWVKEHNDYIKGYSHNTPNISFDLVEKQRIIDEEKQKKEEEKKHLKEALNAIYEDVLPFVNKHMEYICRGCFAYAASFRKLNAASNDLISRFDDLGSRIEKEYPTDEETKQKEIQRCFKKDLSTLENWLKDEAYRYPIVGNWRYKENNQCYNYNDLNILFGGYIGNRGRSNSPLGKKLSKQYKFFLEYIDLIEEYFNNKKNK